MNNQYLATQEQLQALVNYLVTLPYKDVSGYITMIQNFPVLNSMAPPQPAPKAALKSAPPIAAKASEGEAK